MTHWFPMGMASRTGWPFIWLRRIQIASAGASLRYEYTLEPLVRYGVDGSGNGVGYWRSSASSVPDANVDMSRGWWCYQLPVNPDGTIKLPDDFYTAKLPGQE